jgi:hypothetical protein
MDKVQIKLKNGESLEISIKENRHSCFEDIVVEIESAIDEKFVQFNECLINVDQIVYLKPVNEVKYTTDDVFVG